MGGPWAHDPRDNASLYHGKSKANIDLVGGSTPLKNKHVPNHQPVLFSFGVIISQMDDGKRRET